MAVTGPSRNIRPPGPATTTPWIRRTRLLNTLSTLPDQVALVLVVAPPGYGKTTTLLQWARTTRGAVAWVRLGPEHDRQRLVGDLARALLSLEPAEDILGELATSPAAVPPDGPAGRLASAVAAVGVPVTIVLDDLHLLRSRAASDLVLALAVRLPAGSRIVATADRQPRLQLGRLRSEGRCVDIGAGDLAFSQEETAALLGASDVPLDAEAVGDLQRRTEGWPAGVHLAALTLEEAASHGAGLRSIDGGTRLIADYFRDVVLSPLSAETVRFLMRTAVLDRMCASLCDAVLHVSGSGAWLDEVRALGLFVVPLDEERGWFRYHQLFAETLRGELRRREPGEDLRILRDASVWYEAHRMPQQAIGHAVGSGDALLAARLIVTHAGELSGRGQIPRVRTWLEQLDPHALEQYPPVAVTAAWIRALSGEPAEARRALRIAERCTFDGAMPDGAASFASACALVRAALAPDGVEGMIVDARRALALEPAGSAWRAVAQLLDGVAHLLWGATAEADAAFERVARSGGADHRPAVSVALGMRALTAAAEGDWSAAAASAAEAGGLVDGDLWGNVTSIAAFSAGAAVALHRGDTQQALNQVREAERLYRTPSLAAFPWAAVMTAVVLGRLSLTLGDVRAAEHKLTEARRALALLPSQGVLGEQVDAFVSELEAGENDHGRPNLIGLTGAELRVVQLLPTHYTLSEIGDELEVSRNTVKTQVAAIYRKLGAVSRTEAVRRAQEAGLLKP